MSCFSSVNTGASAGRDQSVQTASHSIALQLPPARNGYRRELAPGRGVSVYYDRHPPNEWSEHAHAQTQVTLLLRPSRCLLSWRTPDGCAHKQTIQQASVWIVPAQMPHALECPEEADMVTLFLEPAFVRETLGQGVPTFALWPLPQFCSRDLVAGQIVSLFGRLCAQPESQPALYVEGIGTTLGAHVLRTIFGPATRQRAGMPPELLGKLMDHIDAHLAEPLTLDVLARFVGMCRSRLTESFKASVGLGVHQYVVQRRVAHAKELLETTDLKELHIAHLCGFSDDTSMARAFRRVLHCTPSSVRTNRPR